MYFWQIRKLREQLATSGLSSRQAFSYYLATAILGALLYEAVANGPSSEASPVDVLDAVLYFSCLIGGIIWSYRQNGGADGIDFLDRLVPIAWVMFWRLVAVVIPFFVVVGAIDWYRTGNLGRPGSEIAILILFMNGLYGWMWWRIGVHMRWIADRSNA